MNVQKSQHILTSIIAFLPWEERVRLRDVARNWQNFYKGIKGERRLVVEKKIEMGLVPFATVVELRIVRIARVDVTRLLQMISESARFDIRLDNFHTNDSHKQDIFANFIK